MDKRLHLLETFSMQGNDGKRYVVRGYEHLARLDGSPDLEEHWQPTGVAEYRLASGEHVAVDRDGVMTVASTGVTLSAAPDGAQAPLAEGGSKGTNHPKAARSGRRAH
jgi:hypothetical protein